MNAARLDDLIACYQHLSPANLAALPSFYHDDARFIDPFNDVHGCAAIEAIFAHMFQTLDAPRFVVDAHYQGGDGVMLRWRFQFSWRGKLAEIPGSSLLQCGEDGRVILHQDYWDSAALYQQLPWLGGLFRFLKNRLATPLPKA